MERTYHLAILMMGEWQQQRVELPNGKGYSWQMTLEDIKNGVGGNIPTLYWEAGTECPVELNRPEQFDFDPLMDRLKLPADEIKLAAEQWFSERARCVDSISRANGESIERSRAKGESIEETYYYFDSSLEGWILYCEFCLSKYGTVPSGT